jgi:hypothetical protein
MVVAEMALRRARDTKLAFRKFDNISKFGQIKVWSCGALEAA